MGYDISLRNKDGSIATLKDKHNFIGSNICLGGTSQCQQSITYNYSKFYYETMGEKGIRTLYGLTGKESVLILENAIERLKDDITDNYWDATEGNAKIMLKQLLVFAKENPNAIWEGD